MSVHRALLTEDVLDEIFSLNFTNRLTLASLARVCTVFHEPAIRSLWRLLPKLSAIINLIPSCHVQTLEDVGPQNEVMELSDASLREWSRLRKYARYVRHLSILDYLEERQHISLTNWSMIRRLAGGEPVLPAVRGIFWQTCNLISAEGLVAFLSPSIVQLYIHCAHEDLTAENEVEWAARIKLWIHAVTQLAPSRCDLVRLSFTVCDIPPSLVAIPLSLVAPNLPRTLKQIVLGTDMSLIDCPSLKALAGMPNVGTLELDEAHKASWREPANLPSRDGLPAVVDFPHLESLVIHECRIENSLSRVMTSGSLRFLRIDEIEYRDSATLRQSCAALAAAFPSLQWLSLSLPRSGPQESPPGILDLLEPFFRHRMESVHVGTVRIPYTTDDDDIVALSQAWPTLAQLEIVGSRDVALPQCNIGLRGLQSLATHCSNLTRLRVEWVVVRPEDVAQLPLDPPSHGLRSLRVNEGVSPDTYRLITDKIYPNCKHTLYWDVIEKDTVPL